MRICKSHGGSQFVLKGDVKAAHRRYKVPREDHGYQACSLDADSDFLFLNEVGTFGIASAAYWWSRISGAASRAVLYLMFQEFFYQLLFADDYKWNVCGPRGPFNLLLTVFFYEVIGMPWSWTKFRGGLEVDWVGYWVDYKSFSTGLRRAVLLGGQNGLLISSWRGLSW